MKMLSSNVIYARAQAVYGNRNLFLSLLFFICFSLSLSICGCSNSHKEQKFVENGSEIRLFQDGSELTFQVNRHISDTYHVIDLKIERDMRLNKDGVFASLHGISIMKVPEEQVGFTAGDLNQMELFLLIPADSSIRSYVTRVIEDKGCGKKVKIAGEFMVKVNEDGKLSQSDMPYFYLRNISGESDIGTCQHSKIRHITP